MNPEQITLVQNTSNTYSLGKTIFKSGIVMNPIEQERIVEEELSAFIQTLEIRDPQLSVDVQRALCYIHDHLFKETLTMYYVLDQCHVRSHSFNARFKFELLKSGRGRTTIWEYIQQQRIRAAKRLLQYKEIELFLIAVSLGFKHYETFTRVFRRYTNESPSAFRHRMAHNAWPIHRGESSGGIVRRNRQEESSGGIVRRNRQAWDRAYSLA